MHEKRKCCHCGSKPDSSTALYRFPKPGVRNNQRCEEWAKYCFPECKWASAQFQLELYTSHKMLCSRHFGKSAFWDFSNKKIHKHAAPENEPNVGFCPSDNGHSYRKRPISSPSTSTDACEQPAALKPFKSSENDHCLRENADQKSEISRTENDFKMEPHDNVDGPDTASNTGCLQEEPEIETAPLDDVDDADNISCAGSVAEEQEMETATLDYVDADTVSSTGSLPEEPEIEIMPEIKREGKHDPLDLNPPSTNPDSTKIIQPLDLNPPSTQPDRTKLIQLKHIKTLQREGGKLTLEPVYCTPQQIKEIEKQLRKINPAPPKQVKEIEKQLRKINPTPSQPTTTSTVIDLTEVNQQDTLLNVRQISNSIKLLATDNKHVQNNENVSLQRVIHNVSGPTPRILKKIDKPPDIKNVNPIPLRRVLGRVDEISKRMNTMNNQHQPNKDLPKYVNIRPAPPQNKDGTLPKFVIRTANPPNKAVLCAPQHDFDNQTLQQSNIENQKLGTYMKQVKMIQGNGGIVCPQPLSDKKQRSSFSDKRITYLNKRVKCLTKKISENRKETRTLRKEVKQFNSIKSPLLKSLITTTVQNQSKNHKSKYSKRWSKSVKNFAIDIYKKSPIVFKDLAKVFDLPGPKTLKKIMNEELGNDTTPIDGNADLTEEERICSQLLKRITRFNNKKSYKDDRPNMKILIKGDRKVGKSCLLQRLQGGPFIEEYVATEQIQVAPINWTYKDSDHIVKLDVWEVVDKGCAKKKTPLGPKLENQEAPSAAEKGSDPYVLDASAIDVYENASGVILMMDITKPRTFEYVVKELARVPAELPVVILGNHCDKQQHRQVHAYHIEAALQQAMMNRSGPVRYGEASMRNGFGLRLLHKFLSVPFLRLQRASLLQQLATNQRQIDDMEREIDHFQNSEEAHYDSFVDRLANKRRVTADEVRPASDRSPSIVVGAGQPIVPPGVNPLVAQSLSPKPQAAATPPQQRKQRQFVNPELLKPTAQAPVRQDSAGSGSTATAGGAGALDEFYAGTLDSSFLEDLPAGANQEPTFDSDSDDADTVNPMVTHDQDDLDDDILTTDLTANRNSDDDLSMRLKTSVSLKGGQAKRGDDQQLTRTNSKGDCEDIASHRSMLSMPSLDNDFPLWAGDSSARRSPEGGEDPDVAEKVEKKHKKKKHRDKGDYGEKSERKKLKKPKGEKTSSNAQSSLLTSGNMFVSYDDYDSI